MENKKETTEKEKELYRYQQVGTTHTPALFAACIYILFALVVFGFGLFHLVKS